MSGIISTLVTLYVLRDYGAATATETLRLMGVWPINPMDFAKTMLLVMILFAGPLFEAAIAEGEWRDWIRLRGLHQTLSSWIGWRNFVTVSAQKFSDGIKLHHAKNFSRFTSGIRGRLWSHDPPMALDSFP